MIISLSLCMDNLDRGRTRVRGNLILCHVVGM